MTLQEKINKRYKEREKGASNSPWSLKFQKPSDKLMEQAEKDMKEIIKIKRIYKIRHEKRY